MNSLNKQFSEAFAYSNSPKSKKDLESRVGAFVPLEGEIQGISAKEYMPLLEEYLSPQSKRKNKLKNIIVGALTALGLSAGGIGLFFIYYSQIADTATYNIINTICSECTTQKKEETEFRMSVWLKDRHEENNPPDADWPKLTKVEFDAKKLDLDITDFNLAKKILNGTLKNFCLNGRGEISDNNELICQNIICTNSSEIYRNDIFKLYKDRNRERIIKKCNEYILRDLLEELNIYEIKEVEIKKYGYPDYSNISAGTANFVLKIKKINSIQNRYCKEYEINASPLIDQKQNKVAVITLFNSLTKILDLIKFRKNSP